MLTNDAELMTLPAVALAIDVFATGRRTPLTDRLAYLPP
jgi:hypothetical protein